MTGRNMKGGAKAPPIPLKRLRTPEAFAALLREMEPDWVQPPLENLEDLLGVAASKIVRTKGRTVTHHKTTPIAEALETLRAAAEVHLEKLKGLRAIVTALNLADSTPWQPPDRDPKRRLEDLLAWFGERESTEIAFFDFGESPLEPGEPSWRRRCRLFAAMLGPHWHPRASTHPVSESASIVRALDVLLRAAGEKHFKGSARSSSGGYSLRALVNFLGKNRHVLGRP